MFLRIRWQGGYSCSPMCDILCRMTDGDDDEYIRQRVVDERRRLGWSVRRAAEQATAAGAQISNTKWGDYEKGGELGIMRGAVAAAYGWPIDWPEQAPSVEEPPVAMWTAVESLSSVVGTLADLLERQYGQLEQQNEQLELRVEQIERQRGR
jgi:hypothetical protein